MMNAYVVDDHHGDNGTVRAGAVLTDLSDQRFEKLKTRGLVREPTAAELKAAGVASDEKSAPKPADKAAPTPNNKAAPKPADKA